MFFVTFFLLIFIDSFAFFDYKPNDMSIDYIGNLPSDTYHNYCKNTYSQNGEDGILEQILKELEIVNGTFCEFGASNGIDSSNTLNLIVNHNFVGIAIEPNVMLYEQCVKNYSLFPQVQVFNGFVIFNDKNNDLNAWLKKAHLPVNLDVLSIDIDSDDYYVWENLTDFKPKIVIIEINSYRDPVFDELPGNPSQEYSIDFLKYWYPSRVAVGCSFISAIKLGLQKGYIPIACTGNIIFVRNDLISKIKNFPYQISNDPYDYLPLYTHLVLWNNQWKTNTGLILNVAIRDFYMRFKSKQIDIHWINNRMNAILKSQNL